MNEWLDIDDVMSIIRKSRFKDGWSWVANSRCKYINVRIDMRDGHCRLMDRHGNPISLDELEHQYKTED